MTTIRINGKTFSSKGKSVAVIGNRIYIDGIEIKDQDFEEAKNISISVTGNVGEIEGDCDITINGNVTGDVKTGQGNIRISGDVDGDVKTGQGNITCGDVTGNCKTGMGSISRR